MPRYPDRAVLHGCWLLLVMSLWLWLAPTPAHAQTPDLSGAWRVQKSSWPEVLDLNLVQDAEGGIRGTLSGSGFSDTVTGRVEADIVVLLRYQGGVALQVYRGRLLAFGKLEGDFYGLNGSTSGANADWNGWAWRARRNANPVGGPFEPVPSNPGPARIAGEHDLRVLPEASGITRALTLQHDADGGLRGWDLPGILQPDLVGHYGRISGQFALLRVRTGPQQVWLGSVGLQAGGRVNGQMYTLDTSAGPLVRTFDGLLRVPDNVSGTWQLNGNGWPGSLVLHQDSQYRLTGKMYGEDATGYYSPAERVAVLLRGNPRRPLQAFVGTVAADGRQMSGRFYALDNPASGGDLHRNVFEFAADRSRGAATPALPTLPPYRGHSGTIAGPYLNRPGTSDPLAPWEDSIMLGGHSPDALGNLAGTMYGHAIQGTFAGYAGTLAFVRFGADGLGLRLYVGRSQLRHGGSEFIAERLEGTSYALSPAGGGSPERLRYDWQALTPDCTAGTCQFIPLP